MRELTASEIEFVGGGDFWGGLKEDLGQIGLEIENIWNSFMQGGPSTQPSPVTSGNIATVESVCAQNGGTFVNANGTFTISGLSELGGGSITFTGDAQVCKK